MYLRRCFQLILALPFSIGSQTPLSGSPLRNFQVSQPLRYPEAGKICSAVLVQHTFGNSFGQPAIVQYEPPKGCGSPDTWAAMSLNLTATSNGVQFDRLASLYMSGVEIWRTSTPEPTTSGIIWTTLKDVSKYIPLFAQEGTLILDLGNILDDGLGLTGQYNVTLTARFHASSASHPPAITADIILPLSAVSLTQGNAFSVPPAGDTNIPSLPTNIAQAFVEIYASGNANEEFWYGNVPDEFFSRLPPWNAPDGLANPKGKTTKRVAADIKPDTLAIDFSRPVSRGTITDRRVASRRGFSVSLSDTDLSKAAHSMLKKPHETLSLAVIYSGEFLPSIWRPMLSYGAFDSPTYYVDITPFVPHLCDGLPHSFTLDVVGMGTNFSINSNWIVSGNLQLLLDDSKRATTGEVSIHEATRFISPVVVGSVEGAAPNVTVSTTTNRTIHIQGHLTTGSGKKITTLWHQQLEFTNTETYSTTLDNVSTQHVTQMSRGSSVSHHNDMVVVSDAFVYPFALNLSYFVLPSPPNETFFDYGVALKHSYQREFSPGRAIGGLETNISTTQTCEGTEFEHETNVTIRTGRASEQFSYKDERSATYFRDVEVATQVNLTTGLPRRSNSSLIHDRESGSLAQ